MELPCWNLATPDIRKQTDTVSSLLLFLQACTSPALSRDGKANSWARASMQILFRPALHNLRNQIGTISSPSVLTGRHEPSVLSGWQPTAELKFRRDGPRTWVEVGEDAQGVPGAHQLRQPRHLQRRWLESRHGVHRRNGEGEVARGLSW
jgi:hypothetical protein